VGRKALKLRHQLEQRLARRFHSLQLVSFQRCAFAELLCVCRCDCGGPYVHIAEKDNRRREGRRKVAEKGKWKI
jgi:hypothetical protein